MQGTLLSVEKQGGHQSFRPQDSSQHHRDPKLILSRMKDMSDASDGGLKRACPHCGALPSLQSSGLSTACILLHPGLPSPWLSMLVRHHLDSAGLLALFRTCKGLARLVLQHCKGLTLTPLTQLQHAAVLTLASGCNNIHLRVYDSSIITLDVPSVRQCITQLTLYCFPLTRKGLSMLYLEQLTHLHTIHLLGRSKRSLGRVDNCALQEMARMQQAGGLCALTSLEGYYPELCKLAPMLGQQITHLTLHECYWAELDELAARWPALLHLQLKGKYEDVEEELEVLTQLIEHPTLTHVTAPARLMAPSGQQQLRSVIASWKVLVVTGCITIRQLADLPLRGVKQLQLTAKIPSDLPDSTSASALIAAALSNMQLCEAVQLVPCSGDSTDDVSKVIGAADDRVSYCEILNNPNLNAMPVSHIPFIPELIRFFADRNPQLQGALVLANPVSISEDQLTVHTIGHAELEVLQHIPLGIETLVFLDSKLDDDCSWPQVIAKVPGHIQRLVLYAGYMYWEYDMPAVSEADWFAILDAPAPAILKEVVLRKGPWARPAWVPWPGSDLERMQARAAAKWPHVKLSVGST